MSSSRKLRFEVAKETILEAGSLALQFFSERDKLEVEYKGLQDFVSIADKTVEQLIRDRILSAFPEDGFLGEENAKQDIAQFVVNKTQHIWIVDPIDGTSLFLNGLSNWCVSIALLVDSQLEIGMIYDPIRDELFRTELSEGAFLNDIQIQCHSAHKLNQGMMGIGYSHRRRPEVILNFTEKLLSEEGIFVAQGSSALALANVAAGRLLGFYEGHINSWDCAAGILLVQEAGGWTNDFLANEGLSKGNFMLACCSGISDKLQAIID